MQLGYSKDVINNNPKIVSAFGGNRNTITYADDYLTNQGRNQEHQSMHMGVPKRVSEMGQYPKNNERVSSSSRSFMNLMQNK